jgi:hypothetical protein
MAVQEYPKDCPIRGTDMDPITTREWQMLLDAIQGLKESIDTLHIDISSQKIRVVELGEQYRAINTRLDNMDDSNKFRWQYLVLPVAVIVLTYLLPRLTWVR